MRTIITYIKSHKTSRNKEKAFGILKGSSIDAIKYQDRLRSEWE